MSLRRELLNFHNGLPLTNSVKHKLRIIGEWSDLKLFSIVHFLIDVSISSETIKSQVLLVEVVAFFSKYTFLTLGVHLCKVLQGVDHL